MPPARIETSHLHDIPSSLLQLRRNLEGLDSNPDAVDISGIRWASPMSLLPIACRIAAANLPVVGIPAENVAGYLRAVGFPDGAAAPEALETRSGNFIPICRVLAIDRRDPTRLTIPTMIERYCEILGELVLSGSPHATSAVQAIAVFLEELSANVKDHSEAPEFWMMAQFFPQTGILDMCLLDAGIGIYTALSRVRVPVVDDAEAVLKALEGWSSKEFDGPPGLQHGTGLRTTLNIITKSPLQGELVVISGGGGVWVPANDAPKQLRFRSGSWKGALAWMRVRRPDREIRIQDYIHF